jgi:hypothetical protein
MPGVGSMMPPSMTGIYGSSVMPQMPLSSLMGMPGAA